MYYALLYETVENYVERRTPFRPEHLGYAQRAHDSGLLVMAGAFDPADGVLFVFRADGPGPVEDFARNDPYVKNGLVTKWRVRAWTVMIGAER